VISNEILVHGKAKMRSMKFEFLCFASLLFALSASTVDAQLVGAVRTTVVDGYQKSCFRTQRQGSPNAGLSDATLSQYCRCAANYYADLLNEPLLRDIESGRVKPNPVWNQMAAEYCRMNFSKY
jgi:hypothetical protein